MNDFYLVDHEEVNKRITELMDELNICNFCIVYENTKWIFTEQIMSYKTEDDDFSKFIEQVKEIMKQNETCNYN